MRQRGFFGFSLVGIIAVATVGQVCLKFWPEQ